MSILSSKKRPLDGIRSAIIERCEEARRRVSGHHPSAEDIHSSRKSLKKARGWLRLFKAGISTKSFREHNRALRDAARPLSEGRDAQILLATLNQLLERNSELTSNRGFGGFKVALEEERKAIQRRLVRPHGGIAQSRALLRRSIARSPT